MGKRRKEENYKGESFPLLNLIEEMKDEKVGVTSRVTKNHK
jgi:hypothetical protein